MQCNRRSGGSRGTRFQPALLWQPCLPVMSGVFSKLALIESITRLSLHNRSGALIRLHPLPILFEANPPQLGQMSANETRIFATIASYVVDLCDDFRFFSHSIFFEVLRFGAAGATIDYVIRDSAIPAGRSANQRRASASG